MPTHLGSLEAIRRAVIFSLCRRGIPATLPIIGGMCANWVCWGNKIWVGCGLCISGYNTIYEVILDHIPDTYDPFRW